MSFSILKVGGRIIRIAGKAFHKKPVNIQKPVEAVFKGVEESEVPSNILDIFNDKTLFTSPFKKHR